MHLLTELPKKWSFVHFDWLGDHSYQRWWDNFNWKPKFTGNVSEQYKNYQENYLLPKRRNIYLVFYRLLSISLSPGAAYLVSSQERPWHYWAHPRIKAAKHILYASTQDSFLKAWETHLHCTISSLFLCIICTDIKAILRWNKV